MQYILATDPNDNPISPYQKIVSVKMLPITGGPSKVRRPCTMEHEVLQGTKQGPASLYNVTCSFTGDQARFGTPVQWSI